MPTPLPPPDDEAIRRFFAQVGTGRIEEVRAALDASPWLASAVGPHPFWGGRPQALHVAVESRRRDMFDLLLERGADVNGANDDYDGWSPLMLAINRAMPDMRDELRRRGAHVGLLEALMLEDDARVEALLREGLPDVMPNGGSILAFARTPFAIDRLLKLGAPIDLTDRWGSRPIDAMSRLGPRGRALVAHLAARGAAPTPQDYARMGDLPALERLCAADPAVARQDAVLMAAVGFRHPELVEWLLRRGASANARSADPSRHTALHSAAWNGDLEMVQRLLRAGADPEARDEQYDAPPVGWAATAHEITNNPSCADVVSFLRSQAGERTPGG